MVCLFHVGYMGIGGDMLKDKLRQLRTQRRLTLKQVGLGIYKSTSGYEAYEAGRSTPNPDTLKLLCKLFGVSPNEMLEWD